jgi:hypothetical protein
MVSSFETAGSESELSQVVVKMKKAMAHGLGLRQLAEQGVRSKFALDNAEPLE